MQMIESTGPIIVMTTIAIQLAIPLVNILGLGSYPRIQQWIENHVTNDIKTRLYYM